MPLECCQLSKQPEKPCLTSWKLGVLPSVKTLMLLLDASKMTYTVSGGALNSTQSNRETCDTAEGHAWWQAAAVACYG